MERILKCYTIGIWPGFGFIHYFNWPGQICFVLVWGFSSLKCRKQAGKIARSLEDRIENKAHWKSGKPLWKSIRRSSIVTSPKKIWNKTNLTAWRRTSEYSTPQTACAKIRRMLLQEEKVSHQTMSHRTTEQKKPQSWLQFSSRWYQGTRDYLWFWMAPIEKDKRKLL